MDSPRHSPLLPALCVFGAVITLLLGARGVSQTTSPPAQRTTTSEAQREPSRSGSPDAVDPDATNFPYPHPVQFFPIVVERQSLRMAFMDVAPRAEANGKTVVLLHGKNFSGAYWEPTIEALTAAGYRVIAPDQIGFGKSSKPEHFQFTFQTLADTTRALLDSAHVDRAAVMGHSMGGMLATRFALMFPERVEKLVLVDPIGLEDWKTAVPYKSVDEQYAKELKTTPDSIREYESKSYFGGAWKPEYDALIALPAGWTKHPDYPRVAWCAALTTDMIFTQPVLYEFPLLRTPTLLIIGQRDRTAIGKDWAPKDVAEQLGNYPVLGRRAAAAIPDCKLVEIQGAGHLPQVEKFDEYRAALLDFLR
jgi:pimeloyl-ACP methyl ester carboxylesterase